MGIKAIEYSFALDFIYFPLFLVDTSVPKTSRSRGSLISYRWFRFENIEILKFIRKLLEKTLQKYVEIKQLKFK